MASHDAVAEGLVVLRLFFPTLPDSEPLLLETVKGLREYDDEEVRVAVERITHERKRQQGAPALADLREACASVASIRRASAVQERRHAGEDAYCPFCGTRELQESELWPNGKRRMVPRHEWGCVRGGAEGVVPQSVNMAAWPGRRAAREVVEVQPKRGLAALANVLPEVAP